MHDIFAIRIHLELECSKPVANLTHLVGFKQWQFDRLCNLKF